MAKCDTQIKQLDKEIAEKEELFKKTQFWLKIVREKGKRVEKQKKMVQQYEQFLEEVRAENPDEYPDIKKILSRYEILENTQSKLRQK